jgi:hypothetical protein
MKAATPEPDDYVAQKTRRIMARAALRKIGRMVAEWEEEDRLKDRWARRFTVLLGCLAVALCVVYPALLAVFSTQPRVPLLAAAFFLGIMAGVALLWWSRRTTTADDASRQSITRS